MFAFSARGRTYEILTRQMGPVLRFPGHWMYEPSVITPSEATGGKYVLVFSSNLNPGKDLKSGDAIFVSSSPDGVSDFTAPKNVLTNTDVEDLCDFGDARALWDGSAWHVYVYAVTGDYRSGKCSENANIVEATGTTLESLAWITYPGTKKVRPVIFGQGSKGVAEDMQWFFLPDWVQAGANPFLITFNDWGFSGTNLLGYQSDGLENVQNLYEIPVAYDAEGGTLALPDAILADSLDAAALGDPAIGFESNCAAGSGHYQYVKGVGFYNDLALAVDTAAPPDGVFFPGSLESTHNDENGPRMFRPRLARDAFGFIHPLPDIPGFPRIWSSYLYYNDAQVGSGEQCGYFRWFTSDQRFSVSYIEIREQ